MTQTLTSKNGIKFRSASKCRYILVREVASPARVYIVKRSGSIETLIAHVRRVEKCQWSNEYSIIEQATNTVVK
jgi:hypothetical protein